MEWFVMIWNYIVSVLLPFVLVLVVLALGTVQGTEITKKFFSFLGDLWAKRWEKLAKFGKFIAPVALSALAVYGFDLSIFDSFGLNVDTALMDFLTVLLGSMLSNKTYDRMKAS